LLVANVTDLMEKRSGKILHMLH